MGIDVVGNAHAVLNVDGPADHGRNAGGRSSSWHTVEIDVRAGFCDPGGELLAVVRRSGWRAHNGPANGVRSPLPHGGAMTTAGSATPMAAAVLLIGLVERVLLRVGNPRNELAAGDWAARLPSSRGGR
jgi:hypothetical protein